ncbi:MAG: hypothetical protein Q4G70_00985 [Pseudomonadota bacterium]|nr:hypothetical protein [Pseudomonadota bacterium]
MSASRPSHAVEPPVAAQPINKRLPARRPEKPLAWAALALWLVSLVLPGFSAGKMWLGWDILIAGVGMGWIAAPGGLAAYANLCFLWVVARLLLGRGVPLIAASCALLLACLAPMIQSTGIPSNFELFSSMRLTYRRFDSWGWGALIWGLALLTAAAATLVRQSGWQSVRWVWAVWALVLVGMLPLARAIGGEQLAPGALSSLVQDAGKRVSRMASVMWFKVQVWARTPALTAPRLQPIPGDEWVALHVDPAFERLRYGRFQTDPTNALLFLHADYVSQGKARHAVLDEAFLFPVPSRFQQTGAAGEERWQWSGSYGGGWWVAPMTAGDAEPAWHYWIEMPDARHLRVSAAHAGNTVLQQKFLLLTHPDDSKIEVLLPGAGSYLLRALVPGWHDTRKPSRQLNTLPRESGSAAACPLGTEDVNGQHNRRRWDGHEIVFPPEIDLSKRVGLCSPYLMLLLDIRSNDKVTPVAAYDRKSLEPIYVGYGEWQIRCLDGAPAPSAPGWHAADVCGRWDGQPPQVTGFSPVDRPELFPRGSVVRIVLHTTVGDLTQPP